MEDVILVKPSLSEMSFRQELLSDEKTMSYNHAYGGTIDFPIYKWDKWYNKWIGANDERYLYRYIYSNQFNCFVGETAYHYIEESDRYICDVIVHDKYRNHGFGKAGLNLLCQEAKNHGIIELYDEILLDNSSIHLFMKNGFEIVEQTDTCFVVKKKLKE